MRALLLAFSIVVCAAALSAATFVVDSTGEEPDADLADGICRTALGTCTLRAAIEQANALPGADTIAFNIPGPGVHTISPTSALPTLADDAGVTIDGYTQPGSHPNTLAIGSDAVLLIELDGTLAGQLRNGLTVGGIGTTLRGLVINRFDGDGVAITGGYGHRVSGCLIGTDPVGMTSRGNRIGVLVSTLSTPAASGRPLDVTLPPIVIVGGPSPGDRNTLSGNKSLGLFASFVSFVSIQNNYIGTDASGEVALPNQGGGMSLTASIVTVGGGDLFSGGRSTANVVSGNAGSGILMGTGGSNFVAGNFVGTNARGTAALPNGTGIQDLLSLGDVISGNLVSGNSFYGVRAFRTPSLRIAGNRIGTDLTGTAPLGNALGGVLLVASTTGASIETNLIAYNGGFGIAVGGDPTDASNDNRISGNSIHDNAGLGIDLGSDGVTTNNDCDNGRGPNLLQNYPVLTSAASTAGTTVVRGSLNSVPNTTYQLEFFANTLCDPSGHGQGQTYLGSAPITTGGSCNALFELTVSTATAPGSFITTTATDPAGNTSEFSACVPLTTGLDFYTVAPCRVADTRGVPGPYGGPSLDAGSDRSFTVAGQCAIAADAKAVAFNFAVTQSTAPGDLRLSPGGSPSATPPALYYASGQTRAKNGVIALGAGGDLVVHVDQASGAVHLIIDVTGYFR